MVINQKKNKKILALAASKALQMKRWQKKNQYIAIAQWPESNLTKPNFSNF